MRVRSSTSVKKRWFLAIANNKIASEESSTLKAIGQKDSQQGQSSRGKGRQHTKDEFFRRGEHIYSESHLILINLQAKPPNQGSCYPKKRSHGWHRFDSMDSEQLNASELGQRLKGDIFFPFFFLLWMNGVFFPFPCVYPLVVTLVRRFCIGGLGAAKRQQLLRPFECKEQDI